MKDISSKATIEEKEKSINKGHRRVNE